MGWLTVLTIYIMSEGPDNNSWVGKWWQLTKEKDTKRETISIVATLQAVNKSNNMRFLILSVGPKISWTERSIKTVRLGASPDQPYPQKSGRQPYYDLSCPVIMKGLIHVPCRYWFSFLVLYGVHCMVHFHWDALLMGLFILQRLTSLHGQNVHRHRHHHNGGKINTFNVTRTRY
jgi:hypothetical protein